MNPAGKEMKITHVSHACQIFEGQHGKLLSDPWILNEPVYNYTEWKFPAAVMPPAEVLKDVDYICITHSHEDHFHIPSLNLIRRDMPFILAEYDHHCSLRAQTIERVLRAMGFHNIRKLHPWDSYLLKNGIPLISVPSASTRAHDWENSGFIIDHPGCRIIHMNDNISDEALCADIHSRYPWFDIGFIQTAGVSNFPCCFVMPEEKKREIISKKITSYAEQDRLISMLNLKHAVPIAGDFGWLADRYFDYNFTARGTPLPLEDHVKQNHPECQLVTMYPSDTWSPSTGRVRNHPEIDWANYGELAKQVQKKFNTKIDYYDKWIDESSRENLLSRTIERIEFIDRWIQKDDIHFSCRFRMTVQGPNSNFSFDLQANPQDRFSIKMECSNSSKQVIDQTIYIPERIWAAMLAGKLMLNMFHWTATVEAHVPFREDIRTFWSWIEFHVDLNNKHSQAVIEPAYLGQSAPIVRPDWGVLTSPDDWDLPWLK